MWACRTNGAERKEATLARGSVVGVERGKRRFGRVIEVPLPDAATYLSILYLQGSIKMNCRQLYT
eukprot:COSAG06_NODE_727_length_12752_cov_61.232277_12_plen_65_part_00